MGTSELLTEEEGEEKMVKTLGYHRKMCVAVFGEDSPATKFLDGKIAEQGEDEEVLADERQLIAVLMSLHMGEPAETQEE